MMIAGVDVDDTNLFRLLSFNSRGSLDTCFSIFSASKRAENAFLYHSWLLDRSLCLYMIKQSI